MVKKVYIVASIIGKTITQLIDDDPFINTFTGTGTSNGNNLGDALKFAFISLTSPLIENIDPNLNPLVTYKVKTIIEVTISLIVKLPDPDGDNAYIKIPFTFFASSADLTDFKPIAYGATQVAGATSSYALTPTSASILAEIGILNLVLQKLIPQLIYEISGVASAGLADTYCDLGSDGCIDCYVDGNEVENLSSGD